MTQQERILKLAQEKIVVVGPNSIRYGKTYKAAFELAIRFALDNLWIPVKEDLPKLLHEFNGEKWSDRVLVRLDNGDIIESFYWEEDRGFVQSGWGYIDMFNKRRVAHWMPVPKLPEGGEKMKYRITTTFPVYFNGGCLPSTGYVLQVLQEGIFRDKWVDVKTFAKKENAEKMLKMLQ